MDSFLGRNLNFQKKPGDLMEIGFLTHTNVQKKIKNTYFTPGVYFSNACSSARGALGYGEEEDQNEPSGKDYFPYPFAFLIA